MTRPHLVNGHTHLELGWHGAFRPKQPRPFALWMKRFMQRNARMRQKEGVLDAYHQKSVVDGIQQLKAAGITHVGDISFRGLLSYIRPCLTS